MITIAAAFNLGLNCLKMLQLQAASATLSVKNVDWQVWVRTSLFNPFLVVILLHREVVLAVHQFFSAIASSCASSKHLPDRPTSTCWADDIHNKTSRWRDNASCIHARLEGIPNLASLSCDDFCIADDTTWIFFQWSKTCKNLEKS